MSKATTLAAALEKQGLPSGWHDKILRAMSECGMLGDGAGAVHAVSSTAKTSQNLRNLDLVQATAARDLMSLGVPVNAAGRVDLMALNSAMTSAGWDPIRRMTCKGHLAGLN